MRLFARTILDVLARLMAVGWLVQTVLPTLCCCCLGNTAASAGDQTLQLPASCCCHTLLKPHGDLQQRTSSHAVVECPGTSCPTCDFCDCSRASDNRPSTLRRRLLEDSKLSISGFVLPCLNILPAGNSHWASCPEANARDSGDLLSAAERCVSLQRFLL